MQPNSTLEQLACVRSPRPLRALSKILLEGEEVPPKEFAEVDYLVTNALCQYNEIWQSGETAGEIPRRLGALACERIPG
ncbi:MAG: hypothetical protein DMG26_14260, partial [Acidobacteria bacterium]